MSYRIAMLTPEYPSATRPEGGLAAYTRNVADSLSARGHDVAVFAIGGSDRSTPDGAEVVAVPAVASTTWFGARRPRPRQQEIRSRRMREVISQHARRRPFDVLHVPSYGGVGLGLRESVEGAMVCRVSSYGPLLRSAAGRIRTHVDHLLDYHEIRQAQDADLVISPSQLMADVYARFEALDVEVVRSPVNRSLPSSGPNPFRGRRYFVWLGTLNRVKGIDVFAEAVPSLLEEVPDLELVLIGRDDGLPDHDSAFDLLRRKAGTGTSRIHHLGTVLPSVWVPVVQEALAVVMPSRVDNYPNACLEAQSLGVPVIGTYGSSLDEIVEHGVTGLLCPPGDPEALHQAMTLLTREDQNRLTNMGERARERVHSDDPVDDLLNAYSWAIERRGRR